jgi:hypothetical protein
MPAGFVYVLVNSAMPGLVKVGKTSRLPADRATELSGVTGVATPFIVAFEQYFIDCEAAEEYVHTSLARAGYREAPNREFFRAPTNEVIRVIMHAPGARKETLSDTSGPDENSKVGSALVVGESDDSDSNPWSAILEEADSYYHGFDDQIQDYREAMKLYKDAARLGSMVAFERIGNMYLDGEGVQENLETALEYFKSGAAKGNYYCYAEMAKLFSLNKQKENSIKSWKKFFDSRERYFLIEVEERGWKYPSDCVHYLRNCRDMALKPEFIEILARDRYEIIASLTRENPLIRPEVQAYRQKSLQIVREYLPEPKIAQSTEPTPLTANREPEASERPSAASPKGRHWWFWK